MMNKIPVTIFTGFLGAGKTTILNQVLDNFKDQDNAVIENEFGEISIDGDLISNECNTVFELNKGCLCCAMNQEFYNLLRKIVFEQKTPDRLWVEATGVADTTALIDMFKRPDIASRFDLWTVVCVVDATNIEERIEQAVEVSRQIIASDTIVINKTTGLDVQAIKAIETRVQSINQFAHILSTETGEVPPSLFEGKSAHISQEPLPTPTPLTTTNAHKINSVSYQTPHAFHIAKVETVMNASLMLYAHQIFRIKAIVRSEENRKTLIQAIGKSIEVTDLGAWEGEQDSKIVVIGMGLQEKSIQRLFKNTVVKDTVA